MENKPTTIQVSLQTSEEIKAYCTRLGRGKGVFVDAVWQYIKPFIDADGLNIFEDTPYLPIQAPTPADNNASGTNDHAALIDAITAIVEGIQPSRLIEQGISMGQLQARCDALAEDNARLSDLCSKERARVGEIIEALQTSLNQVQELTSQLDTLQRYKAAAQAEFARIREHQPYIGKIDIYEP